MIRQHHGFNGHGCEQTPGDGEGQGSLACCSLWGCRVAHDLASEHHHHTYTYTHTHTHTHRVTTVGTDVENLEPHVLYR